MGWLILGSAQLSAQDDVMMQGFYWDVPVDEANKNGFWWDSLAVKANHLGNAGITGIWTPSSPKGNFGIIDMGYGIFDHFDLGNYNQKGTTETRFGSRAELEAMVDSMHANGIEVYLDVILNHLYTGDSEEETNPEVKDYVFDENWRDPDGDGVFTQYQTYPTNEITWRIPNAGIGDYYIQIKGYMLDWAATKGERGYDLYINWDGSAEVSNESKSSPNWEFEPNNGGGNFNNYPASGEHIWAHIGSSSDIDEYKITVNSSHDIIIKLQARRDGTDGNGNFEFQWAAQTNGYYPVNIWHNGSNLASSSLEARTNTGISYVNHTGTGEQNWTWDYSDFHPVDGNDWLGFPGNDEIITNTKFFGNDLNTFDTAIQSRYEYWGEWITNQIGYDGYRLDFVRGFQASYVASWVNAMPLKSGSQRFVVGEYWGGDQVIHDWVDDVAANGADVDAFDFPLKSSLTNMSNWSGSSHDMSWLNHAGMVRNNNGYSMSGTSIVTFVENHDTGKEHDKWLTRDWDMSYAYILFAEGRPTIFYSHYYNVTQIDNKDNSKQVTAPASLQGVLNELMFIRRTYLGGTMEVLSQVGNPYPAGNTSDLYVARRQGNGTKTGAIMALNDHESDTVKMWVDHQPNSSFSDWRGQKLVNITSGNFEEVDVFSDGRVEVWAPARGYAVWVPKSEQVAYSGPERGSDVTDQLLTTEPADSELPTAFTVGQNYPNPFNPATNIQFALPESGKVRVEVYNSIGKLVATVANRSFASGEHTVRFDASRLNSGIYFYRVTFNGQQMTRSMTLIK